MMKAKSKDFMDIKHEGNMTNLVVLLGRGRGSRWGVRSKRQASMTRLYSSPIIRECRGWVGGGLNRKEVK